MMKECSTIIKHFFLNPIIHFKVDIVIHSAATVRFDENLSKVNFIVLIVLYQVLAVIQVIGSQVLGYRFFQLLQFLVSRYQLLYRLLFLGSSLQVLAVTASSFQVLAFIQVIDSQVLIYRFQLLQLPVSRHQLLYRLQVPRFQVLGSSSCYSFQFLGTSCYFGHRFLGSRFQVLAVTASSFWALAVIQAIDSQVLGNRFQLLQLRVARYQLLHIIGYRFLGLQVLGSKVLGSQVLGSQVLGSKVLGSKVLGSKVLGSQVIVSQVPRFLGSMSQVLRFQVLLKTLDTF